MNTKGEAALLQLRVKSSSFLALSLSGNLYNMCPVRRNPGHKNPSQFTWDSGDMSP